MSDDSDVNVKFGATITDLLDKVGQVQGVFKDLVEQFAGIAAVFAGGAAFKEFIDSAVEVSNETVKMAKTLGIAGDEASALKTAVEDVGGSVDTYTGAFTKFSRQLANNGDTLKQYGVDVEGVRAGTVSGTEAFQQALKSVQGYKAGIDQNEASTKLFGRSFGDVQTLLKLTPALIEEARKKNEELNLNISVESVEAARKYGLAMHDVGDVITGVKKTIGEALIPIFTEASEKLASFGPDIVEATKAAIGTFVDIYQEMREIVGEVLDDIQAGVHDFIALFTDAFGTDAPTAMQVFKNALAIVHAAFTAFGIGFHEIQNAIRTGIDLLANRFSTFASVAERALHFDFSGAQAEWQAGMERENQIVQEGFTKAVDIATKGQADLQKILGLDGAAPASPKKATPYTPPTGTRTFKPVNKDAEAQNAARKALLKAQTEAELAIVKEVLSEQQAAQDDAFKQGIESTKEYYAQSLAITLAGLDAELAARRKELSDAQQAEAKATKPQDKLKFAAQEAAIEGQINVLESQRGEAIIKNANAYRDAERARLDALAAFAAAQAKAGTDDDVAKKKAALQQEVALRQVTAQQEFGIEQQLENESFAALQANIAARMALIRGSEDEQAKQRQALQLESEAAERDHQNKLTDISNRAELDRKQYSLQAQQAVQSSFTTMLGSWLSGTAKMSDAMRQFAVNVGNQFANLVAKKFTDKLFDVSGINKAVDSMIDLVTSGIEKVVGMFIAGETEKTAASEAGLAERMALEAAAAVQSIATWAATAIANIANFAYQAAAGAFNALVSIPYVGPVLAVAAAAAALATVGGFAKKIVSSAGGDDRVEADGLRLVHKDETILPVSYADPLRKLLANVGAGFDRVPTALPASIGRVSQINSSARPDAAQVKAAQQSIAQPAPVNFTVQAMDSTDVKNFLMKHGRTIATSLQNQGRNFVGLKAAT